MAGGTVNGKRILSCWVGVEGSLTWTGSLVSSTRHQLEPLRSPSASSSLDFRWALG